MLHVIANGAGIVDPIETIITGILYKRIAERSTWSKRKVILCNQYLYQYTYDHNSGSENYKGKFDITNCSFKVVNGKGVPRGLHGFIVENLDEINCRSVFFCIERVEDLRLWSKAITTQVTEYDDNYRKYLKKGEKIIGNSCVEVITSLNANSREMQNDYFKPPDDNDRKVRLIVTSYPRFFYLFIKTNEGGSINGGEEKCCVPGFDSEGILGILMDTFSFSNDKRIDDNKRSKMNYMNLSLSKQSSSLIYKEQISWTKSTQPNVIKTNEEMFEIICNDVDHDTNIMRSAIYDSDNDDDDEDRIFTFKDENNGSKYWINVFEKLHHMDLLSCTIHNRKVIELENDINDIDLNTQISDNGMNNDSNSRSDNGTNNDNNDNNNYNDNNNNNNDSNGNNDGNDYDISSSNIEDESNLDTTTPTPQSLLCLSPKVQPSSPLPPSTINIKNNNYKDEINNNTIRSDSENDDITINIKDSTNQDEMNTITMNSKNVIDTPTIDSENYNEKESFYVDSSATMSREGDIGSTSSILINDNDNNITTNDIDSTPINYHHLPNEEKTSYLPLKAENLAEKERVEIRNEIGITKDPLNSSPTSSSFKSASSNSFKSNISYYPNSGNYSNDSTNGGDYNESSYCDDDDVENMTVSDNEIDNEEKREGYISDETAETAMMLNRSKFLDGGYKLHEYTDETAETAMVVNRSKFSDGGYKLHDVEEEDFSELDLTYNNHDDFNRLNSDRPLENNENFSNMDIEDFREFKKIKKSLFTFIVLSQNHLLDKNNSIDLNTAGEIGKKLMRSKFLPSETIIDQWKATIRDARLKLMTAKELIRYLNLNDLNETKLKLEFYLRHVTQGDKTECIPSKTSWLTQEQLKAHEPLNQSNKPVLVRKPSITYRTKNGDLLTERDASQHRYIPPEVKVTPLLKKEIKFTSFRGTPAPVIPKPCGPVQKDETGVPIDWKKQLKPSPSSSHSRHNSEKFERDLSRDIIPDPLGVGTGVGGGVGGGVGIDSSVYLPPSKRIPLLQTISGSPVFPIALLQSGSTKTSPRPSLENEKNITEGFVDEKIDENYEKNDTSTYKKSPWR